MTKTVRVRPGSAPQSTAVSHLRSQSWFPFQALLDEPEYRCAREIAILVAEASSYRTATSFSYLSALIASE